MMRTALTISSVGHASLLLWGVLTFAIKPYQADLVEAMPVDIVSTTEFTKLTAGAANAPKVEMPKPVAETIGDRQPVEDPVAKVSKKEVAAATDTPPLPEPKPPAPEPKKQTAKSDPIAEALKKDEAKKPEPKKTEVHPPMPPKRPAQTPQPKFDPRKVEALLDKRDPQRLAAAGDTLNNAPSLGASNGQAAQLSQSELDALRSRLAQLWSPPAGAKDPRELIVAVRLQLKPDGTLAGPPMVLTSGTSPLFVASRESAMRAVFRAQPFDMLRPEHYEQWKDIEITFDPRDMIRG